MNKKKNDKIKNYIILDSAIIWIGSVHLEKYKFLCEQNKTIFLLHV